MIITSKYITFKQPYMYLTRYTNIMNKILAPFPIPRRYQAAVIGQAGMSRTCTTDRFSSDSGHSCQCRNSDNKSICPCENKNYSVTNPQE